MKFKTQIQPKSCCDFVDEKDILLNLTQQAGESINAKIVEQHRRAFGVPAYQIWEGDKKAMNHIKQIGNY